MRPCAQKKHLRLLGFVGHRVCLLRVCTLVGDDRVTSPPVIRAIRTHALATHTRTDRYISIARARPLLKNTFGFFESRQSWFFWFSSGAAAGKRGLSFSAAGHRARARACVCLCALRCEGVARPCAKCVFFGSGGRVLSQKVSLRGSLRVMHHLPPKRRRKPELRACGA